MKRYKYKIPPRKSKVSLYFLLLLFTYLASGNKLFACENGGRQERMVDAVVNGMIGLGDFQDSSSCSSQPSGSLGSQSTRQGCFARWNWGVSSLLNRWCTGNPANMTTANNAAASSPTDHGLPNPTAQRVQDNPSSRVTTSNACFLSLDKLHSVTHERKSTNVRLGSPTLLKRKKKLCVPILLFPGELPMLRSPQRGRFLPFKQQMTRYELKVNALLKWRKEVVEIFKAHGLNNPLAKLEGSCKELSLLIQKLNQYREKVNILVFLNTALSYIDTAKALFNKELPLYGSNLLLCAEQERSSLDPNPEQAREALKAQISMLIEVYQPLIAQLFNKLASKEASPEEVEGRLKQINLLLTSYLNDKKELEVLWAVKDRVEGKAAAKKVVPSDTFRALLKKCNQIKLAIDQAAQHGKEVEALRNHSKVLYDKIERDIRRVSGELPVVPEVEDQRLKALTCQIAARSKEVTTALKGVLRQCREGLLGLEQDKDDSTFNPEDFTAQVVQKIDRTINSALAFRQRQATRFQSAIKGRDGHDISAQEQIIKKPGVENHGLNLLLGTLEDFRKELVSRRSAALEQEKAVLILAWKLSKRTSKLVEDYRKNLKEYIQAYLKELKQGLLPFEELQARYDCFYSRESIATIAAIFSKSLEDHKLANTTVLSLEYVKRAIEKIEKALKSQSWSEQAVVESSLKAGEAYKTYTTEIQKLLDKFEESIKELITGLKTALLEELGEKRHKLDSYTKAEEAIEAITFNRDNFLPTLTTSHSTARRFIVKYRKDELLKELGENCHQLDSYTKAKEAIEAITFHEYNFPKTQTELNTARQLIAKYRRDELLKELGENCHQLDSYTKAKETIEAITFDKDDFPKTQTELNTARESITKYKEDLQQVYKKEVEGIINALNLQLALLWVLGQKEPGDLVLSTAKDFKKGLICNSSAQCTFGQQCTACQRKALIKEHSGSLTVLENIKGLTFSGIFDKLSRFARQLKWCQQENDYQAYVHLLNFALEDVRKVVAEKGGDINQQFQCETRGGQSASGDNDIESNKEAIMALLAIFVCCWVLRPYWDRFVIIRLLKIGDPKNCVKAYSYHSGAN